MYPSQMSQNNISFDTFYGVLLDPLCYNMLNFLDKFLGTNKNYPSQIITDTANLVVEYVKKQDTSKNKKDLTNNMYVIMMNSLLMLQKNNISLKQLMNPSNIQEYILLKSYLLPLLDLLVKLHPHAEDYNIFCCDYLLNDDISQYKYIYIVENYNDPSIKIQKIPAYTIQKYLIDNNLLLTITGALFYTHTYKKGVVYDFIVDRLAMRSLYKKEMKKYDYGSELYNFYDMRQATAKINANSSYGLSGMSNFRFSNKHMAKSITISARLCLKIAQICTEMYLDNLKEEDNE